MDKDLVASGTNENGSFPLLPQATAQVSVKKGDEISSVNYTLVSNITSELSGLSLETSSQATKSVNEPTVHQQEITKSVEGGDTSADANEDMSVNPVPDEATPVPDEGTRGPDQGTQGSEDQANIHRRLITLHAPLPPGKNLIFPMRVETEPKIRRCQLVDRTLCILILEATLFLFFPVPMAGYSFAYFHQCEGIKELPTLLLVVAIFSALTLIGRMMVNIAAIFKWSHDKDKKTIRRVRINAAGEYLSGVLFLTEFIDFFTKYARYRSLCNADFFGYVFYMNIFAAVFMSIRTCCTCKTLVHCFITYKYGKQENAR